MEFFGFQSEFGNLRLASASQHRGGHWVININLVIICFTLRLRGRSDLLFLEWRFDKFVCWTTFRVASRKKPTFRKEDKVNNCFVRAIVLFWASGLGIGFWLRGVQPRTTVR